MGDNTMSSTNTKKAKHNVCNSKELTRLLNSPPKHLFSNIGSCTFTRASERVKEKSKEREKAIH